MVREFKLVNEKGQEFSLMDIKNYCLLTEPSGLGYSYNREYEQLGNTFIETFGKLQQKQINGIVNFSSYDNYNNFANFIEGSENLKFIYVIPFKEGQKKYFKDVKINSLDKTEIQTNGIISEPIVFDCLSLWYEQTVAIYNMKAKEDEIRWDFVWDSSFVDYDTRNLPYINTGHIEAPILIEINGYVKDPKIELYVEGELYQTVTFNVEIEEYEKFLYGTRENDFYINRQNTDGSLTSLFSLDVLEFENDNVIRLPINKSCELRLKADNEIQNAQVTILTFYKLV